MTSRVVLPSSDKGRFKCDTPAKTALIAEIKETHRQRDDLLRAEGSLTRQIKAIGRRMKTSSNMSTTDQLSDFAALHLQAAKDAIHPGKLEMERRLKKLAKDLPVYSWMKSINGFGEIGLCQIIGECGDLSNFNNPAKLWKYLGLAPITEYPVGPNGGRLYSRRTKSMMYVIGTSLIKKKSPYRVLYLKRKADEHAKGVADGLVPASVFSDTIKKWEELELPELKKITVAEYKKNPKKYRTAGHIEFRALRYVEKRLLRNLWREWNNDQGY